MTKELLKNGMRAVHPGEVLREDFLVPLGMSAHALSKALHVTPARVNDIVREKRGITPDTALRLARFFGGDARFWLNLQQDHDLKLTGRAMSKIIDAEVSPLETALHAKVEQALHALISPDDLSTEEQELYFEKLAESHHAPSPIEDKFFADLRARGGAVGDD